MTGEFNLIQLFSDDTANDYVPEVGRWGDGRYRVFDDDPGNSYEFTIR